MIKKLFFALIVVPLLVALGFNVNVKAVAGAEFYAHEVYTPRFTYLEDEDGLPLNVMVNFSFYDEPVYDTYNVRFEQIDYDGNYIRLLSSRDYEPAVLGLYYEVQFIDDFTRIRFPDDENIAFYHIVYNELVIYSGAVMKRPNFEDVDGNSIELGDYVYNSDALPDVTEHDQYTINEDDYFIVHYRFDEDYATDPSYDLDIVIHDLSSGILSDSITTTEILTTQLFNEDLVDAENVRNSFLLITTDGELPPFAVCDFELLNTSYGAISSLGVGTYQISLKNSSGTWIASPKTPLNIANENNKVFDLTMSSDYYEVGDDLRITFFRDNANSSSAYSTTLADDAMVGTFGVSDIDDFTTTKTLNYDMSAIAEDGDLVNVTWTLVSASVFGTPNTTYYKITVSDTYDVVDSPNVESKIFNLLASFNLNNEIGFMLVLFIVFLIVNISLGLLRAPLSIFVISDVLILIFFIFLGFAPVWFSVMLGMLILVGLLVVMRRDV